MTTAPSTLPAPPQLGLCHPLALILVLVASRVAVPDRAKLASREASMLRDKAVTAQAAGRFADAAEYARHGASRAAGMLRTELLCLRADSLARGHLDQAQQAFVDARAGGGACAPAKGPVP